MNKKTVDLFKSAAGGASYEQFRPRYPLEIISKILDFGGHRSENRTLAIDVGCGTGVILCLLFECEYAKMCIVNALCFQQASSLCLSPRTLIALLVSILRKNRFAGTCACVNCVRVTWLWPQIDAARRAAESLNQTNCDFVVGVADRLPAENRSADLVVVAQTMHWLDEDVVVPEFCRVLKPSG